LKDIDSHKLRYETITSQLSSEECLDKPKLDFEKEQKDWRKKEKLRLAKLVDSKTEHIKETVAKSMEPELTQLLNQNKRELHQMRLHTQREIDELKKNLELDGEERLTCERKKLFEEALYEDVDMKRLECDQQKYVMDLALQHETKLQSERKILKNEFEQERAAFENQCKALRESNTAIEDKETEEEQRMLQNALAAHRNEMEQFSTEQHSIIQSKKVELDSNSADWRKMREGELRRIYLQKLNARTQELQSKSMKEVAYVESRLETERIEQLVTVEKEQEVEMHVRTTLFIAPLHSVYRRLLSSLVKLNDFSSLTYRLLHFSRDWFQIMSSSSPR